MVNLFLNTATVQPASFEEKLTIAARAGYAGVELFADELEPVLDEPGGIPRLARCLSDHGLGIRRLLPPLRLFEWHAVAPRAFRDLKADFDRLFILAAGLGVPTITLPVASGESV